LIKKNNKEWEECLPIAEYAYNRARHSTTGKSPFEVVYGFNPLSPLDILPLPLQERINMDASARVSYLKKLHEDTRHTIERQVQRLVTKLNVNKEPMVFNIGDLVWLHLRKERFPNERKSKLLPRADGPFKVLERYNNNAYKIDIPRDKYSVSDIFNVKDLSPYHGDEDFDPRSDLSQGRGDDAEHPLVIPMDPSSSHQVPRGPRTRARARALETEVTSLLNELPYESCETWLLPQTEMLCVLRYLEDPLGDAREDGQVYKFTDEEEQRKEPEKSPGPGHPAPGPGHPAPGSVISSKEPAARSTGPGHPASGPEIRPSSRISGAPIIRT
jgi:hypothetical protein